MNGKNCMIKICLAIILILHSLSAFAAETCSRVAIINYQEVLVDVSSSNRGEGLRFYLEKDEVAKELLDEYQENNRPTWKGAALSTAGTAFILAGFLRSSEGRGEALTGRGTLLLGGATMIALSYLISRTKQHNNEHLLQKSIEEYNKRNTPRIFLAPTNQNGQFGIGIGVGQEF